LTGFGIAAREDRNRGDCDGTALVGRDARLDGTEQAVDIAARVVGSNLIPSATVDEQRQIWTNPSYQRSAGGGRDWRSSHEIVVRRGAGRLRRDAPQIDVQERIGGLGDWRLDGPDDVGEEPGDDNRVPHLWNSASDVSTDAENGEQKVNWESDVPPFSCGPSG